MNEDKELIEMAAKACGYVWSKTIAKEREKLGVLGLWLLPKDGSLGSTGWNPLERNGDALRVAVKLGLCVTVDRNLGAETEVWPYDGIGGQVQEDHGECPYAATRRAITRAAAEIGKSMP